jgi:protein TonB
VVVPQVPVVLLPPPPVVTALQANVGNAASSGAADFSGLGQGAGGVGTGFGGGGNGGTGDGDGRGGKGEPAVAPPRHIRGKLAYSDVTGVLPEGHGEAGVEVIYAVNPDGRVSDCEAERSSGYPALDLLVCRLIEQRFVFRPAKDRFGRPARAWIAETHSWYGRPEGG